MERLESGVDPRTGQPIRSEPADWTTHPNNPMRRCDP
jgi:dihydropyrimidine dehydrogenase (NAD+) subunit PreA